MGYCEQFPGCLRRSRMEKEAIYCNGISYLYFFFFFFPLTIMWRCLFGRKAQSRRGRFSLSAGCLSACGEEEADKWERMGAAKEWERGRADLSVICLRFKSKLLTDEKRRCLSGSSPAHQTSVLQHTLFRSFFCLLSFDVYFMSVEASTLSWPGVYLKLSLVYSL